MKNVQGLKKKRLLWEDFCKHFKNRYLSEKYYDDFFKEFRELRLGKLIIDEFESKFTNLLRYFRYLKEEKAKVQRFMNCLPIVYKEWIGFDKSKTMDEVVKKARLCYQ